MSQDSTDDPIGELIALGMIVVIGYGIFRVLQAFAGHEVGDTVGRHELVEEQETDDAEGSMGSTDDQKFAYCERCGEVTERFDRFHCYRRHCKRCHAAAYFGYEGCYCGNCFFCYGHAGGNECNTCS